MTPGGAEMPPSAGKGLDLMPAGPQPAVHSSQVGGGAVSR